MVLAAKMDEYGGKGGWIAAMVLGFILHWPIGLAILAFLIFSGRIRAWRHAGPGRWYNQPGQGQNNGRGQQSPWGWGWGCGGGRSDRPGPTSGNAAFDEYRTETLRRLEEEQKEFVEYLERLRRAKDKSEFDQFMAERRRRTTTPEEPGGEVV